MFLECLVATGMWGIAPIFERVYTQDVSLCTIVFVFTLMLVVLIPIYLFFTRHTWTKEARYLLSSKRHVLSYGFLALVVSLIASAAYLLAIQRSNGRTHLVVALTCTYPVLTAILMYILFKNKITLQEWFGIFFVICGIALLSYKK